MNLTVKLTTVFLMLTIVPLSIVGYLAYDNGRATIEQNTRDRLDSITTLKEAEFERWVDNNERILRALASRPLVQEYTATLVEVAPDTPPYQAAHDDILNNHFIPTLKDAGRYLDWILIRVSDSQVVVSTDSKLEGMNRESDPSFIEGQLHTYVEDITYSQTEAAGVMYISTPVYDPAGVVVAVLEGRVDLSEMSAMMAQGSGQSASEETYLVNGLNVMINDSRFETGSAFKQTVYTDGVVDCLAGNNGTGVYTDYRDILVMGVYHWMPDRQLCIVTEIDKSEAFAPAIDLRNAIFAIAFMVALSTALLAMGFSRTLTGPVRQLVKGVNEIGRGNLDYQIAVRSRDEFGQLAVAINQMTSNLQQARTEMAHSQRLLLALSQAGQTVQRARTPQEVYNTLGTEITALGFQVMVFRLTEDAAHLRVDYLTFKPETMTEAEKLVGTSAQGRIFPLAPDSIFGRVIRGESTVFSQNMAEGMLHAFPTEARSSAKQIATLLGLQEAIYAPMAIDGQVQGVLLVTGAGLTESDVTAISTFANQAATAVENAHLYQEIRYHAENLEHIVAERTAALQESEERFRGAFEHAAIGRALSSAEGRFIRVNRAFFQMLGYTQEELLGLSWQDVIHPDDLRPNDEQVARLVENQIPSYILEMKMNHKQGHSLWVLLNVVLIRDAENQPLYMVGDIQDITERKQNEEDLARQSTLLRTLIDALPDFIYVKDTASRFLVANIATAHSLGVDDPAELVGKTDFDYSQPDLAETYFVEEQQVMRTGKAVHNRETYGVDHNGFVKWTLATRVPLRDKDGAITGLVGINFDITDRRQAEQALSESRRLLRSVIDTIPTRVFWKDTDLNFVGCNQNFALDAGLASPDDLLGKSDFDLVWADRAETYRADDRSVMESGEPRLQFEEPLTRPDGTTGWLLTSKIPLRGDDGNMVGILGTFEDITEHKLAQQALQQEKQFADDIVNGLPGVFYMFDDHGALVRWNDQFQEVTGYSPEELTLMPAVRFFEGEHKTLIADRMQSVFAEGRADTEADFVAKDGTKTPYYFTGVRISLDGSTYLIGVGIDITERIRAERKSAELAAIVASSDDAIIGKSTDGIITSWNLGAQNMYGYTEDEVIGQPISILATEDHKDEITRILEQISRGEHVEIFETVRQRKNGDLFHAAITVSAIRDTSGRIVAASTIVRDISERRRIQDALRASEAQLRLVVENMPVLMDALDEKGNLIVWNRECERVTGFRAEELVGNPDFNELLYPDPAYRRRMQAELAEKGGDYRNWEWETATKDGQFCTIAWSNISQHFPISGWSQWGIGVDVTERIQVEQAYTQKAEDLARSNAELEQFAYVASHDLQEPLRMVTSYMQLLQRRYQDRLDSDANEFIGFAVDGAMRMKVLINDLLAFSRVGTRGKPFDRVPLEDVLKQVSSSLQMAVSESNATITHEPLPEVYGDETQLSQLLQNLIGNALKFRGDVPPEIHIGATREEDHWLISVRDNGIGIDTEYFDRIFIIFQRLHGKQDYPGTGIGLAICKKIVQRHQGRIWVESQPGQGSTFYFTLPTPGDDSA